MRKLAAVSVAALVTLGIAACGSSSSSTTSAPAAPATTASPAAPASAPAAHSAPGAPLALAADPTGQLKFDKTSLSAKAGKVSIDFTNQSQLGHNLTIEQGGKVIAATPTFQGGSKTVTATLKPGTYTFFCSVPGHRMAGMQGTLTVT